MPTQNPLNFDYSYLSLPDNFYSLIKPSSLIAPELFILNNKLCNELDVSIENKADFIAFFSGHKTTNATPFAQAYAGHQFGHFTKLGDGRAIVIGEYITADKQRFDMQLKGSGRTPYSRGGDGKATLKAMLREYLISEAIHYLNIPSSRSLAVIKTGESVYREALHDGAALVRMMKSHLRIGTFEYAAHFGSIEDLKMLTTYTIKRLYPEIEQDENPVISLLKKVMMHQIELVINWMRVGFIHGVMNTDNIAISGETFDYGPCAFINAYNPYTVFSSIDHNGRYAFGNQSKIIKWNLTRFAETLLPILHTDKEKALQLAQTIIDTFDSLWQDKYYGMMLTKIGIEIKQPHLYLLVEELLDVMKNKKLDYTNTFLALSQEQGSKDSVNHLLALENWLKKWKNTIDNLDGMQQAKLLMRKQNPVFIPRNHIVEQALNQAVRGNLSLYENLLKVISKPYEYQENCDELMQASESNFDKAYQTFCGT